MDQIQQVKQRYRKEEWKQLILDYQSSDMKLLDWCSSRGVTKDKYYYWLRKIREEVCESNLPMPTKKQEVATFKKLEVISPVVNTQAAVIIRLPNATIEITEGTSQQTIQAVLLALQNV